MEERPAETNANVDSSAPPSVAQLAGRFREQAAAAKETPASKPTRRKPPCSLPLFPPKVELGQNGEEKSSPNTSHPPKIKVKSSPLIEKLQANLVLHPATLLPGASPKSPGVKAVVSPFHSPPSTPRSPGVWSRASEPEEVPISFDQPPEGSHLPCYNKVRTRGSIKRRPPSRRFRRSQSDCGELADFRPPESSQENGAQDEGADEVFQSKAKSPGSPPPGEGAVGMEGSTTLGSQEKLPLRRTPSRTEKQEEAADPPQAPSAEAENGCGSPTEERPAAGQRQGPTAVQEEMARGEECAEQSRDPKRLEDGAAGRGTPQSSPGGAEGGLTPGDGRGEGEQEEGTVQEPRCSPGTSRDIPKTEDNTSAQDTKM